MSLLFVSMKKHVCELGQLASIPPALSLTDCTEERPAKPGTG